MSKFEKILEIGAIVGFITYFSNVALGGQAYPKQHENKFFTT